MATFAELHDLYVRSTEGSDALFQRVKAGVFVVGDIVRQENPGTPARRAWAASALRNPEMVAQTMWAALMAAARLLTVAQLLAVDDETIQIAILAAVDVFAEEP